MKITKEQKARILELDPTFFDLEVGKWYKLNDFEKFMFCFNGEYSRDLTEGTQYGFNRYGDWSEPLNIKRRDEVTQATDIEVENTLIKEAEKRGFIKGVYVDNTNIDYVFKSVVISDSDSYYLFGCDILCSGGVYVYVNGRWANIIEGNKYYKTDSCFYKISSKGLCIQVVTDEDYLSISKCSKSFPFSIGVKITDVATENEFNVAFNSISKRLKNLAK